MKYYLFLSLLLFGCAATKSRLKEELTIEKFKERALCNCIAIGLDPGRGNSMIQQIIPYDPVASVLFDSLILQQLKPVFEKMMDDSIKKIGTVSEAAQGIDVYHSCMRYYKSDGLHQTAKYQIKKVRKIAKLEEFISARYPAW